MMRGPERWRKWAQSLAGRGGSVRRRAPLESLLLSARRVGPVHRIQYFSLSRPTDLHIALSPRFELSTHSQTRIMNPMQRMQSTIAPQRLVTAMLESRIRQEHTRDHLRELHALAERVYARVQRVEERVSRSMLVTVSRATDSSGRSSYEAEQRQPSRTWPQSHPTASSWSATQPAMSQVNLESITDNVMRQIDSRLTAWRERMGRS